MAERTMVHAFTIKKTPTKEWRPSCVCGWRGSLWRTENAADLEATRHRAQHEH